MASSVPATRALRAPRAAAYGSSGGGVVTDDLPLRIGIIGGGELTVVGDHAMVTWDDLAQVGPLAIYDKRVVARVLEAIDASMRAGGAPITLATLREIAPAGRLS